jgi:hypothetical protein
MGESFWKNEMFLCKTGELLENKMLACLGGGTTTPSPFEMKLSMVEGFIQLKALGGFFFK